MVPTPAPPLPPAHTPSEPITHLCTGSQVMGAGQLTAPAASPQVARCPLRGLLRDAPLAYLILGSRPRPGAHEARRGQAPLNASISLSLVLLLEHTTRCAACSSSMPGVLGHFWMAGKPGHRQRSPPTAPPPDSISRSKQTQLALVFRPLSPNFTAVLCPLASTCRFLLGWYVGPGTRVAARHGGYTEESQGVHTRTE